MKEKGHAIKDILALAAIISVAFGVYFFNESRYALAGELKQVEQRLDYKITGDQLYEVKQDIRRIERKYGIDKKQMPVGVREEYEDLLEKKSELEVKKEQLIKENVE